MSTFTINPTKLEEIQRLTLTLLPGWTAVQIKEFLLTGWAEGQEHQDWLDMAPVSEIVSRTVTGLDAIEPKEVPHHTHGAGTLLDRSYLI